MIAKELQRKIRLSIKGYTGLFSNIGCVDQNAFYLLMIIGKFNTPMGKITFTEEDCNKALKKENKEFYYVVSPEVK